MLRTGCGLLGVKVPNFWWGCLIGIVNGLLLLFLHGIPTFFSALIFQGVGVPGHDAPVVLGFTQVPGILPLDMFILSFCLFLPRPLPLRDGMPGVWFLGTLSVVVVLGLIFGVTAVAVS